MKNVLKIFFTIKYFIITCTIFSSLSFNTNAAVFNNFTVQVGNNQVTANGTSDTIINNLTINGRWFLDATSGSSNTDLIFNGTQTVGGTGELIMSDNANNRLRGDGVNALTVGTNLTLRGSGKTFNLPGLINNGSILAQGVVNELLIQSGSFTNNGVLRAEGAGGLHLLGVNVTNNTSVDVNAGSSLQLGSFTTINGVINVAGSGTASASKSTFDGVTLNGDMQQSNLSNTITNGLTLNGAWNLNATTGSSVTGLNFNGTQSIGGIGEIVMSDNSSNRIGGDASNTLTIGVGTVVRGAGEVGFNIATLVNEGQILAQGITNELLINSGSLINNGVLRAEGAGGLHLLGVNVTNNTSVDVNAGSSLQLGSFTTINGVINVAGSGTASASKSTFDGVTLNGDMQQSNLSNTITNGLTLNGAWNLNATTGSSVTGLNFNGTQSIGGIGEIVMSDNSSNRIGGDGSVLTTGVGTTIRGAGTVGFNISNIQNNGFIRAQGIDQELLIRSSNLTNSGLLSAEGIKGLKITSGSFTTNGQVEIVPTSVLNRTGDYIQTNGTTNVDGTLNVTGLTDIQGGRLSGNGQINGTVANSGTVGPGNSPGHMSINGDYSQSIGGTLETEIGGLVAGTEYDWLDISGQASLSGVLNVALFDSGSGLFAPSLGDTFDILSAASIVGQFDVLTLAVLGNGLDWDVSYILNPVSTDFVRLSVVSSVPIPPAVWLFGSGLLGLIGVARRKQV